MELQDKILVSGKREAVFEALNDPAILKQAIPGCEDLEATSATTYNAVVSSKVGPLKIKFKGTAELSDIIPPMSYTISGEGKGGPAGHAKVTVRMNLEEHGDTTFVEYNAKADIGGKLAQLGGALIERTSKKLTAEFFDNLENLLAVTTPESDADSPAVEDPIEPNSLEASSNSKTSLVVAGLVSVLALLFFLLR